MTANIEKLKEAGLTRIGIAIPSYVHARLQEVVKTHNISQSKLLKYLVSTMSYKETAEFIRRGEELEKLELAIHTKASSDMLQHVRGRSSDTIRQMTEAANNVITDNPEKF
jgi:hypothetical protein